MTYSEWTDLDAPNNFTTFTQPSGTITQDSTTGIWSINYSFLTEAGVDAAVYGSGSTNQYYNTTGLAYFTTDFGSALSSGAVQTAMNAITKYSGTTYYTDYFGDVAKMSLGLVTATDTSSAIQIGALNYNSGDDFFTSSGTLARTITSTSNIGTYGDIWLNSSLYGGWSSTALQPGNELFTALLHELGHALGLGHPTDGDPSATNNSAYYTIMTEVPETLANMNSVYLSGLQMDDIAAIQYIYGANYDTRHTNTLYGMGDGFGATASTEFVYTIWDGGGTNVIDASSYSGVATIDLRQGMFSSIGPADTIGGVAHLAANNVAIAYNTVIQNAIGTDGDSTTGVGDVIIGNAWNNVLAGGAQNDQIYSDGAVHDTNVESTGHGSYVGDAPTMQNDVLIGGKGNDTLYSGQGNNVLDGGYNKSDVNDATALWSTDWDSAHQFTADTNGVTNNTAGTQLDNVSLADSGADTANYSALSNAADDPDIKPGSTGIALSWSGSVDSNGYGIGTVEKGASGVDGTDTLLSIEKVVGTAGDDTFTGIPQSLVSGVNQGVGVSFDGGAGNDHYNFTLASGVAISTIHISDVSGHNTLTINLASGDTGMNIWTGSGCDPTSHAADLFFEGSNGSGYDGDALEVFFNTQQLATVEIVTSSHTYEFRASDMNIGSMSGETVSQIWNNLYGSSISMPGGGAPTVNDPGTGSVTGQIVSPAVTDTLGMIASNGGGGTAAWGEFDYAADTMHPMVLTSFASDTAYWQTWVKDINLIGITPDDVTLKWSGTSTDTLTISVASLSKAIDVTHFTSGQELFGIAVEDTAIASAISADSAATLTSTGLGDYTGNYSAGNGMESMTFGSVDVTYFLDTLTLGGGTVWDMQSGGLTFTGATSGDTLYARDGHNDTLLAQASSETLYGSTGDTTMVAAPGSNLYNGTGADTDVFSAGMAPVSGGGDTIHENTSGSITIAFHGIDPSAVTMWDNSYGYLTVQYSPTDQITVAGGVLDSTTGFALGSLTGITFDDSGSTTWDTSAGLNLVAASDYQTLYGTTSGGDTLTALGIGDTLYAYAGTETLVAGVGSTLYNGTGTDTDIFSAGKAPISGGGDYLYENTGAGTGTIAFHGIDPSAVTMWDNSSGYFVVHYSSTDQITVAGGTLDSSGFTLGSLHNISFDDVGSTNWDLTGGIHLTATGDYQSLYGTSGGGDTLTAGGTGDYLNAYAGTETLVAGPASTLYNGTGTDTDVFSAGKSLISGGGDYLYENTTTGTATIAFHGIDPSAVTMWDNSSGYFVVHYSSTDQFTVVGGTLDYSTGFALGSLSHITFDDVGSTNWDMTGALNLTAISDSQSLYGTGHGDTMTAEGNGDTLNGIAGNNTMVADNSGTTYYYGGSGDDLMVGGSGSATNYMTAGAGTDTFKIESASSSTTVSSFSTGDKLDFSDILTPVYDPLHDALANFVQEATSGGSTTFSVDTTGSGTFTTPLVTLAGVTGLDDVATLVASGHLIVHS